MVGTLISMWNALQTLGGLVGGKKDFPKLKDEEGNWLPMHYSTHNRAPADDLTEVWIDGHTICDDATGVPVARWSYSKQELQQVKGFTIQGFPVYADVGPEDPVWSTIRPGVPAKYGTPGTQGSELADKGGAMAVKQPYPALKGEKLAAALGQYGPLELPVGETPETGDSPQMNNILPGLLTIGGIVALAMGATVPGAAALGAAVLMHKPTPQRSRGGTPPPGGITSGRREP